MSSEEIAVRVANLSKLYEIYNRPQDRLKQSIYPRLRKLTRQEPSNYYREFWALKDISFEVKKGETVGIIGRNGSGKSTLLQIICGTLAPTSGTVETNGRVAALLELGSGFNPEFTGRENVFMNGAVIGLSREEIAARFDDIAAFADIGQYIEQPIKTYSSGMVVRLAFAVAINVDPQILVVDEALSVGDELFQRKCFARIETIKSNGSTILFVSHSGATVVEFCDRAMLLDLGEKLAMGAPKIIVGKYLRLLYAPDDKRILIREEIRSSTWNSNRPEAITLPRGQAEAPSDGIHAAEAEIEEFFDPNLVPQSTLAYESQGARIESPQILTLAGDGVNCLKRGKTYRYTYKVRFDKAATNVRFGMLIKTTSGLELGGVMSALSADQTLSYIAPGSLVHVAFRFACVLNPGTYFLNSGVRGVTDQEESSLHRVLDVCMFRVLPSGPQLANGVVDFNGIPEIIVVDNTDGRESAA
jgi:lipopolysaccharide transport system ATP-binding protein